MVKEKTKDMLPDIKRTIIMEAPIQKVWNAIATPEGLAAWLMPNNFQSELGYEFTFQGKPMGKWDGIVRCKVMELNPPKRLGFTWFGNNMNLYVSFELMELEKEKTQFTLVHSGWSAEHAMLRERMYEGWCHLTDDLRDKVGDNNGRYLS